jgi:EAL domain-containing protein (putative c-di-GMP-specific phosphodiesterase class I)/ActR/RegA family two-component response regulator
MIRLPPDARLMIVDDGATNVELLTRMVQSAGVENVDGTTDPSRAVELYLRSAPDLVLLDLHMPGMDGVAVMEAIAEVRPADDFVPILVLTGDVTTEARGRALAAGANDFLTKPFDGTEVLLRIRNLLVTRFLHLRLWRENLDLTTRLRQHDERELRLTREREVRLDRIRAVLDGSELSIVFQPIVDLETGQVLGAEALARFDCDPRRPPDQWFAEAASVGLGVELELAAVELAIAAAENLPDEAYLAVNLSPEAVASGGIGGVVRRFDGFAGRLVVELTEHSRVDDYGPLSSALSELAKFGVRFAVDDAGSGFAGLQHLLRLAPDIIKLDLTLTRGIEVDPVRRALASSLVAFARDTGATITAEGIERAQEFSTLRALGVTAGQGYYVAAPAELPLHFNRLVVLSFNAE